jgi:hypothetical protein
VNVRRWKLLGIAVLGAGIGLSTVPASAQLREQLQEMLRPPPPPPPPEQYRGRREEEFRRGEEYRERLPPPGPGAQGDRGQHWDEIRERMSELRTACEDGDRRACIRFGIIIGENRERRAQWRREQPDMFWWER